MALPKFSGVYRSPGGAYENPQTVLDKSGFYQAKTISEAGARIAESINAVTKRENAELKQARKDIEEDWNFQQEQSEELMIQMQDAGINNKSFYDLGYNIISERSKVNGLIKKSQTNKERSYYQGLYGKLTGKLVQYRGLISKMKDAGSTYNDDVIKDSSKAGRQGGVALAGDPYNQTYNLGMPSLFGATRGSDALWYEDDNGQVRVKLTSDQIKRKNKEAGKMVSVFNPIAGNYMEQVSDNIDVNALELLDYDPQRVPMFDDEVLDIYESSSVLKDGQLQDEFLRTKEDGTPDTVIKTNDEGTLEFIMQNTDVSRINTLTKSSLEALKKTYLDDPKKARILYHNVFGKPMDDELTVGGGNTSSLFNEESINKFSKAFDEYNTALVLKSLSPKVIKTSKIEIEKPEKLTAAEKKAVEKQTQDKAAVENIEELDISSAFAEGPSQEPGRGVLNLNTLEKLVSRPPYNINVSKVETVGGEGTRKLTKSVEGADRSVTIFDSATDGEVKAALKFLETGTSFKPTANVEIINVPNLP